MKKSKFLFFGLITLLFAGVLSTANAKAALAFRGNTFQVQRFYSPASANATVQTAAQSINTIVTQAAPAVVSISAYKDEPVYSYTLQRVGRGRVIASRTETGTKNQKISSGSGFFITSGGYILTNKHVVADTAATYKVTTNGVEVASQIVYRDPNIDLAIVKIDGQNYSTLTLGDSSTLQIGDSIYTIGNALGKIIDSTSSGTISALDQTITVDSDDGTTEQLSHAIQTSAKLYPGDSGGPLLNDQGQVVGIDTATATGRRVSVGFSLPVNTAKQIISSAGISL